VRYLRSTSLPLSLTSLLLAAALALGCGDDADSGDAPDAAGPGAPDAAGPGGADAGGTVDAAAPVTDPGSAGSYTAHVEDDVAIPIGGDTATSTICSPSSDGGSTPAAGPFPLVVASPGFQIPRAQYASMCEHLASWGFVVILQDYAGGGIGSSKNHQDLAEDIGTLIDWALGGDSGLAGRIDASRIATVGHSLGGKLSILAAILDDRIGAVVGWDPVDAKPPIDNGSPSVTPELMDQLTVPLAVLGETLDSTGGFTPCAPADDNYTQYFDYACAAPTALQVTIDGADHMDWLDDRASCGLTCSFCQTGATEDAHTREVTRRVTAAFLLQQLVGTGGLDSYLTAPDIGAGATVRTAPACE